MSDEKFERLLRQALEVNDLLGEAPAHIYRTSTTRANATPTRRPLATRLRWMVPAAAAAALTLAMFIPQRAGSPRRAAAKPVPADICREPGVAHPDQRRIDVFYPAVEEDAFALVLFRAWSEDCQCMTWELHEFEDGTNVARVPAGEELEIPVDVTNDPPLEQVFLLAIARRQSDLPADRAATGQLLACLNDSLPPGCPGEPMDASTTALASCLPPSVTVVPQPFFVE